MNAQAFYAWIDQLGEYQFLAVMLAILVGVLVPDLIAGVRAVRRLIQRGVVIRVPRKKPLVQTPVEAMRALLASSAPTEEAEAPVHRAKALGFHELERDDDFALWSQRTR